MDELQQDSFAPSPTILLFDEPILSPEQTYEPFAYTDILTEYAGIIQKPILHFWEMHRTIILGMKDTRVPFFAEGCQVLKDAGYHLVIRNAGGLAVASDQGILNVSLILPNPPKEKLSISTAYEKMVNWMRSCFESDPIKIQAYEIENSYCPGEFDLSINGKKFAGIAQRRVKNGIAVMIYLSVNGDQQKRGQAIRNFYLAGAKDEVSHLGYPSVQPTSMATLSELTQKNWSISDVKEILLHNLPIDKKNSIDSQSLLNYFAQVEIQEEFQHKLKKMADRNQLLQQQGEKT